MGSWKASKREGYGVQRYSVGTKDESSYSGEWKRNYRHGRGKMVYGSGNVYDGEWIEVRSDTQSFQEHTSGLIERNRAIHTDHRGTGRELIPLGRTG